MTRAREPWPEGVPQENRASITAIYDASLGDNPSRREIMSDYMDGWNAGVIEGCNRRSCLEIASRFPGTVEDIVAAAEKLYAFVRAPAAPESGDAA